MQRSRERSHSSEPLLIWSHPTHTQVQDMLKGETDEDGGKGGRALAVQDVNAPAEYVWDRILDFGNYNKMVSYAGGDFLLLLLYANERWVPLFYPTDRRVSLLGWI